MHTPMSWIFTILGAIVVAAACPNVDISARKLSEVNSDVGAIHAVPDTPDPSEEDHIRLMSFNTRYDGFDDRAHSWRFRFHLIIKIIEEFGPDSIGLQEPTPAAMNEMIDALPGYASYVFDNGVLARSPILYNAEKYNLAAAGGFQLFEGTEELGLGSDRDCTWIHLVDKTTGRGYYHYNIHPDPRVQEGLQRSAVALMQQIAERPLDGPFVVTGDFNAVEWNPMMQFLRGERSLPDANNEEYNNPSPLVDTFRVLDPDAIDVGTAGGWSGDATGPKIDYIMVPAGTTVISANVVRTNDNGFYPSDHAPVTAVIEFPSAPVRSK